ncbi:hypothetical protein GCM10025734_07930 [Kitasatospora paranensis]
MTVARGASRRPGSRLSEIPPGGQAGWEHPTPEVTVNVMILLLVPLALAGVLAVGLSDTRGRHRGRRLRLWQPSHHAGTAAKHRA